MKILKEKAKHKNGSQYIHFDIGIARWARPRVTELGAAMLAVLEALPVFLFGTDFSARVGRLSSVPLGIPHPTTEAPIFSGQVGMRMTAGRALVIPRI